MLHAVVMAGGSGTRFWPASRQANPKQLLNLAGADSMIQATINRFDGWVPDSQKLVVTNRRLVAGIQAQLPQLPPSAVIGEPCKRDTAPCVGVAAAWVAKADPEAIMVVTPADHVIQPDSAFREAMEHAARLVEAQPKRIVTFGIKPSYPAESFGYIQCGENVEDESTVYQVERFREKPKADVAKQYLESGGFYWNSGIFVWKAQTILDELKEHEPQMYSHIEKIQAAIGTDNFETVFQDEFAAIVGKSIDYAVMEKAKDVVVIEAPFEWDDVGSWLALPRLRGANDEGNTVVGTHLGIDTKDSVIRSEGDHLIVTVGLNDCLVVHTPDATLVADKHQEERVREVVKKLEANGWKQYL